MQKITLIFVFSIFLNGCFSDFYLITPYRSDVNQGSVLNKDDFWKLKIGMSKTEVQNLLGSPSVQDPFHRNRWDYINRSILYQKDNISSTLTLYFEDDLLSKIDDKKFITDADSN